MGNLIGILNFKNPHQSDSLINFKEFNCSKPFNRPIESLDNYLNVTRDDSGQIVSAKSLSMSWFGSVNYTLVTDADVSNSGAGLPVIQKNHD